MGSFENFALILPVPSGSEAFLVMVSMGLRNPGFA